MKIKSLIAICLVSAAAIGGLHAEEVKEKPTKAEKKARMLEKYDTDKDGKMSKEERAAMKAEGAGKVRKGKKAVDEKVVEEKVEEKVEEAVE